MTTETNTTVEISENLADTVSVSGVATFKPYDPKSPTAPVVGGRVVKCLYKSTKVDGKLVPSKLANSCLEIPYISEDAVKENMEALLPHVVSYLETVQDQMVKNVHATEVAEVEETSFSIANILTHLEESSTSGKLTKEQAEGWFDSEVADNLTVLFADKLGVSDDPTEEEAEKLTAICKVYRTKIAALVGPKTFYTPDEAELLKKSINLTEANSTVIGSRFVKRLDQMIEAPKKAEELFGL
jgi:hypothetical protein